MQFDDHQVLHCSLSRCPFGWAGADCSRLALPACRLAADAAHDKDRPIHCGMVDLRLMPWRPSCECHRQCHAHIKVRRCYRVSESVAPGRESGFGPGLLTQVTKAVRMLHPSCMVRWVAVTLDT